MERISAWPNRFVLLDPPHADLGRRLGGQVLAPGDHLHVEGLAIVSHALADAAEAEQAKGAAGQDRADGGLPAALAQRPVFRRDVAHGGDHQAPGQLGRGVGDLGHARPAEIRVADDDAVVGGRPHVQIGQARADDEDQLQVRQTLDQAAWQGGALAQGAEHLKGRQQAGRLVLGKVPVEPGQLGARRQFRPVGGVQSHAGIVIENGDLHGSASCEGLGDETFIDPLRRNALSRPHVR